MYIKRLTILCLVLTLLVSAGCGKEKKRRYQAQFLTLFDTVTTIVGYSESEEEFTRLAELIRGELERYHELYDIYNDYEGVNNIKTINDSAGKAPVEVDEAVISLLTFAKEQYRATGGKVNVAMGSVLSVWHDYREAGIEDPENAELPPPKLLRQAAEHIDINDMIIDTGASTVYLNDPLMRLDVGAVAKGYAVRRLAEYLKNMGIDSLLVSVGGNVAAIGGKPAGGYDKITDWNIGVQNPDKESPRSELMTLAVSDRSVVSSGIYERYYTVGGKYYHHIIDPATLMPSTNFTAVTVICPDSGAADALSTAIFNMSLEEGRGIIESVPDTEALWILNDGTIEYSDGFKTPVSVRDGN